MGVNRHHSGILKLTITAFVLVFAFEAFGARQEWIELKDCRFLRNESGDADSFRVRARDKTYIFRLYFVDAPETDMSIPERVEEQAKEFLLSPAQTLRLGEYASRFTREKLARPFTVFTCLHDARGRSKMNRYYALVRTADGEDLSELLVANGLARVFGRDATPPGITSARRQWEKLERLEREAKAHRVGAWGADVGRMAVRRAPSPASTKKSSFDAFFHPEKIATPTEAEAILDSVPSVTSDEAVSTTAGSLDVNAASATELAGIPGVGAVLAKRIIEARPFQSADDLRAVKGIGPKIYMRIRPYFAGSKAPPKPAR